MSDVKLIAISKPEIEGLESAEELVAYCARVSNPSNQMNSETAPKLMRYLINNSHWSPLEMVHITMEITTTRDIARQILRHRSFSFQEFSQRYADPTQDLGFEMRATRLQDQKNRQNSIEINHGESESAANLISDWEAYQSAVLDEARIAYTWAIQNGIAKEQARAVLPEGLTVSRMYMAGSLRSWVHYCDLRMKNGTQKEHIEVAEKCWRLIEQRFPSISGLL
jgi:thymidylate synthase (FAD)